MKIPKLFFAIIIFLNLFSVNSQSLNNNKVNDSIKRGTIFKKSILPATLIGIGVLVNNSHFEKKFQIDLRNKVGSRYELRLDDYLQFAPVVEMYVADAFKIKSKNHWFDQTKYLFISNLISATITYSLKRITNKTRPNGSPHSFPSGHTTFAFTNATVLYNEFQKTSPVLAYSGYAFATTTAAFRIINNKHWMSDVLVGAGVGILVTALVYHFKLLKNFNPFKKTKGIVMVPFMDNKHFGVFTQITF
ncbi:phosphatase PAP2 family protein [Lutibacter sp.]|uniref:phosphatase PAP2 family protein n=1 Tax=Lutibacter sp. TaxID=1925666 RepID=UPI0025C59A5F|nr:phosphatase PAP2 family protein [Lutibacter sp.]MCF6182428.1 phosphatase PAP2 family protein [Lutibacter sp.]